MTPLRQGSSGQGAPNQAVFLSYASQDAAAVERIAEALRAAGVEVWFDRNELVGGDAWDRKIRQQIRECALFVPVISAATQVRGEGYFRLEWKLAVDRSHLMAPDQPFLLPVVIDDTPDAAARVADEFRAVQWTRLPAGETPVKFCTRLKALLGGSAVLQPALGTEERGLKHRATPKPSRPWLVPTALGLAAVIAVAALLIFRPKSEPAAQVASHQPTAEKSAPLTEAQQLVAKARAIWEAGDELNRETYVLAEELLLKAEKLDPTEASAWALHAIISRWFRGFGFDMSPQRQEALRMQAERAAKLAPGTLDADLATIAMRSTQAATAAQEALVELARRHPGNARVATALGMPMSGMAQDQTILDALQHSHAADPDNVRVKAAILNAMYQLGRIEEAEELVARWLPSRPNGRILLFDVHFKMWWRGDLVGAATAIERWPAWLFLEDRGVQSAGLLWHWKRDGERLLRTANGFLRDYVRVSMFTGPRAQTWSVIARRLISTKSWLRKAASIRPRFGASSCQSSSFEILPVEINSNFGGNLRSQNDATKSASFVTMMRASRVAKAVNASSGVRWPAGRSKAWTTSWPTALNSRASRRGSWASTSSFTRPAARSVARCSDARRRHRLPSGLLVQGRDSRRGDFPPWCCRSAFRGETPPDSAGHVRRVSHDRSADRWLSGQGDRCWAWGKAGRSLGLRQVSGPPPADIR
jgi:tetratricopeptide (TPR) repeat protein